MLQENMDFLALAEQRANALDFLDIQRVEQLRGAELREDIGELQVAQQRIVELGSFLPFFSEVNETMEMFLSKPGAGGKLAPDRRRRAQTRSPDRHDAI